MAPLSRSAPPEDGELRAALGLAAASWLSPADVRELIDRFGSPSAALRAAQAGSVPLWEGKETRRRVTGLGPVSPGRLAEIRARGIRLIAYGMSDYPPRLTDLHHPPTALYLRGPLAPPAGPAVAIVGTRRATEYGRRVARWLAADLAQAGCAVVSGLARGIDAAAHQGALDAEGATVGVLGSGLDHAFPASSRALYAALARRGLLVSEFPPELPPAPGLFPRRNRIIAALADAVVVVQAGKRSGALLTVGHALELGRETFAVPGPVDLPASEGVHKMLRDGACPATGADDVLAVLRAAPRSDGGLARGGAGAGGDGGCGAGVATPEAAGAGADPETATVLRTLAEGPRGADDVAAEAGVPIGRALAILGRLELAGAVVALPGARFRTAGR